MPAAMRRARCSVLPEPAPASTRRFTSSSRSISSRAAWSGSARGSGMGDQAAVRRERAGRASFRSARAAGSGPQARPTLAEAAVVRASAVWTKAPVRTSSKRSRSTAASGAVPADGPDDTLAAAPHGREVVAAAAHARRPARGRAAARAPRARRARAGARWPPREGPRPVRRPVAAGLVVHHLVAAVGEPVDPVDPAAEPEAEAGAEVEAHGLGARERLALGRLRCRRPPRSRRASARSPRLPRSRNSVEIAEELRGSRRRRRAGTVAASSAGAPRGFLAELAEPRAVAPRIRAARRRPAARAGSGRRARGGPGRASAGRARRRGSARRPPTGRTPSPRSRKWRKGQPASRSSAVAETTWPSAPGSRTGPASGTQPSHSVKASLVAGGLRRRAPRERGERRVDGGLAPAPRAAHGSPATSRRRRAPAPGRPAPPRPARRAARPGRGSSSRGPAAPAGTPGARATTGRSRGSRGGRGTSSSGSRGRRAPPGGASAWCCASPTRSREVARPGLRAARSPSRRTGSSTSDGQHAALLQPEDEGAGPAGPAGAREQRRRGGGRAAPGRRRRSARRRGPAPCGGRRRAGGGGRRGRPAPPAPRRGRPWRRRPARWRSPRSRPRRSGSRAGATSIARRPPSPSGTRPRSVPTRSATRSACSARSAW